MAELIGIYDGGFERDKRGRRVGVIHFRITASSKTFRNAAL